MKKFAGLLTAGLVAATLTACNDKEAKSDATKAQAPANNTVYLYTWTEYVPDGLLDDFTKETGIKVIVASLESNETMYAKMKTKVMQAVMMLLHHLTTSYLKWHAKDATRIRSQ